MKVNIIIEFENVSFTYNKKDELVLRNVTFSVKKGELIAFVGRNGAGKTTLIKHINGLLKPAEGEVRVNTENIIKKPISEMAKIVGLAFQNPNHQLFAETVKKELEFGPKNLGIDKEEREKIVQDVVKQFNITHLLERSPLELSGGERRLVSIASVLTMNQQILVLDEPSFGQDYRQKEMLGNYLKELSDNGMTIIVVSHDIDFILEYIPRVIVLLQGEIIADGATVDILSDDDLIRKSDLDRPILLDLVDSIKSKYPEFQPFLKETMIADNLLTILTREKTMKGVSM
ncbi:MAG: ABC transporter ATP-binding protein [Candidatus Heimdallarchaeota archaeon]